MRYWAKNSPIGFEMKKLLITLLFISACGATQTADSPQLNKTYVCMTACARAGAYTDSDGKGYCKAARGFTLDESCRTTAECQEGKCIRNKCVIPCYQVCDQAEVITKYKCMLKAESCDDANRCE